MPACGEPVVSLSRGLPNKRNLGARFYIHSMVPCSSLLVKLVHLSPLAPSGTPTPSAFVPVWFSSVSGFPADGYKVPNEQVLNAQPRPHYCTL